MIDVAVIGLGKMGISHLAIANALPDFRIVAACDTSGLVANGVARISGLKAFTSIDEAIALPGLDAVIVATPTRYHEQLVRDCLARGLHIFCEKPLTLSADASEALHEQAVARGVVTQVGYHNRFVATFAELKSILDSKVLGRISHVSAEAYGPVVTRPAKATWRGRASEGGGALLDYAAHPINLVNWYFGTPQHCDGATLKKIFSQDVEDSVHALLDYPDGMTGSVSVDWSDSSQRKMTTQISVWGERGRVYADRQEIRLFLTDQARPTAPYRQGWNVRYTTELTDEVQFYLRGEEYSAQLEGFAKAIREGRSGRNDFQSAAETDRTLQMIRDASHGVKAVRPAEGPADKAGTSFFDRMLGRA